MSLLSEDYKIGMRSGTAAKDRLLIVLGNDNCDGFTAREEEENL